MKELPFDKIEDYLYTEFHFLDNYTLMSGHKGLVLIDKSGIIRHVMPKVNTKTHHEDALLWIKENKL